MMSLTLSSSPPLTAAMRSPSMRIGPRPPSATISGTRMWRIVISGGLPGAPAIDTSSSTMAPNPPRPRPTVTGFPSFALALLANTLAAIVPAAIT